MSQFGNLEMGYLLLETSSISKLTDFQIIKLTNFQIIKFPNYQDVQENTNCQQRRDRT